MEEAVMEIPWTRIEQPGAGPEAVVMSSKFELKTTLRAPAFLMYAMRLWRQARRSPGILGVSLRAQPLKGTFRTLSAWTDEQALDNFARTDPHAAALNRIRPWTKSSTFRFWSVPVRELTSGTFSPAGLWADAVARVAVPESEGGSPGTAPREP
jgi:quinol monooxygenase YgiN